MFQFILVHTVLTILPHLFWLRQPEPSDLLSVPVIVVILKMLLVNATHPHLFRADYALPAPDDHQPFRLLSFSLYILALTVLLNNDVRY
jgi:hypothetical protein